MAERDTSRDIDQAASSWTARLDRGPLTPEPEEALQAWLCIDPRRKGALLRAQALSMMSESAQALGPDFDPIAFETPGRSRFAGLSRRQALTWTGAERPRLRSQPWASACPRLGRSSAPSGRDPPGAPQGRFDRAAEHGDQDRVRYSQGERRVTLLEGEAYFSVARDENAPVHRRGGWPPPEHGAGGIPGPQARPGSCRRAGQSGQGRRRGPRTRRPLRQSPWRSTANTRLTLSDPTDGRSAAERPQPIAPEAVTRELAWREGKLAFEGETLKQAADTFARYSQTRIQIPTRPWRANR
jgi:transmembrane sensor